MATRTSVTGRTERRRPHPLDAAALERLALRYVERFATTRGKLTDYLKRKVRERGWEGAAADVPALAERLAAAGYIDDRGYAENKAGAMGRRGLGSRRVAQALHAAGIAADDAAPVLESAREEAHAAALAFARRKRIGPFAQALAEPDQRRRQLAAMMRAGHALDLARRLVNSRPGEQPTPD